MMTLADYLAETGISQAAFATSIGVNQATVSRWCSVPREKTPGLARALDIEAKTGGKVPAEVWLQSFVSPSAGVSSDVSQLDSRVLADHADGSGSAPDQGGC